MMASDTMLKIAVGGLFVVGILGFARYRVQKYGMYKSLNQKATA